jgi:hypothetical protein
MKIKTLIGLVAIAVMFGWQAEAQTYDTNNDFVQTFAGSAFQGYLDGQGQATMFSNPLQIVSDSSSNLFVLDSGNARIRKITPDGTVTTFAGGGNQTTGVGTNVSLNLGTGMCIDRNNTIWIAQVGFNPAYLYKITSNATVSFTDISSLAGSRAGICADSSGNIYLPAQNKIYRYDTNGSITVFVGSGNSGSIDGNGVFTSFSNPGALACDSADNIYVWDSGNSRIRRINQNRDVVTVAGLHSGNFDGSGTNTGFSSVSAMCADSSGNIYFACGSCIRKMDAQTNVVTMAGNFTQSAYTNGVSGNLARFNGASGICSAQGMVFVADSGNERIRNITFNPQPQVVSSSSLDIGTFAGITITGVVGRTYQIQSSPDMSAWTTRTTLLLNSSPYLWIDQNPVSGNKFYRAVLLP